MIALGVAAMLAACADSPVDTTLAEVAYVAPATAASKSGSSFSAVAGIDPYSATIRVGDQIQLNAYDANGSVIEDARWSVKNEQVAEVSADGLVTGLSVGEAEIRAQTRGKPATAIITVTKATSGGSDDGTQGGDDGSDGGDAGSDDGGSDGGSTGGDTGSDDGGSDGGSTGGDTGSDDGGSDGGSTGGDTGSDDGGSDDGSTGSDDSGSDDGSDDGSTGDDTASTDGSTGKLLFLADAETGNPSQWCHVHSAVNVGVVTSPVRDGRYSFKSEVRDGEVIYGTERSEYGNGPSLCGNHTYKEGDVNYTALSIYLPNDFPRYNHWSLVAQFKGPHTGTPPMQISLKDDKWEIIGEGRTASPRPRWLIGNVQRGTWNDFVIHAKWSPDPNVGWFEVYYQGKVVIPRTYAQTMYLDDGKATPLFLSVGQYRDTGPTSGTAVLYVDAVKVGTSLSDVLPPAK